MIPLNNISLTAEQKALAALEIVKLHQLVITRNKDENFSVRLKPSDTIEEETIDDTVACLLMSDDDAVDKEHWLNTKTTGYRAQKATSTVWSKVAQVEKFSNYLISPVRKNYGTFFRSMMTTFKAIRCWLRLKLSKKAPKNWSEKRMRIDDRITALVRNSGKSASIEELPVEPLAQANDDQEHPKVGRNGRLEMRQRCLDMEGVLKYNILAKKEDKKIDGWKSYPGLATIISMAREIIETE